jgi:hypothetical protein
MLVLVHGQVNLHKPNNKLVNIGWSQVVLKSNHKQPKLIWLTQLRPLGGGTTIFPIVYFVIGGKEYIEMATIRDSQMRINSRIGQVMNFTTLKNSYT